MTRKRFLIDLVWAVLTLGVALPVAVAMWEPLTGSGRIGMGVGILAWTAAIILIDARLRRDASRQLMIGAGTLIALELIGGLAFSRVFLFTFYWPALMATTLFSLVPDGSSDFAPALVLTIACGGQALGCVFALGRLSRAAKVGAARVK